MILERFSGGDVIALLALFVTLQEPDWKWENFIARADARNPTGS